MSFIGRLMTRLVESRRLFVSLEPRRIAAVCAAKCPWRAHQRVLSEAERHLDAVPDHTALMALLTGAMPKGRRPRKLTVTVSDLLVRYLVIRRPAGVRSLRELRELAVQQLCESFDLDPADWEFRLDVSLFGTRDIVCAIPKALMQDLRETSKSVGLRLASVQPNFAVVARRHARSRRHGWMAIVERESFTLAACTGKRATNIRVVRSAQVLDDLPAELRRNTIALERKDALPVRLAGLGTAGRQGLSSPFIPVDADSWPDQSASWSAQYRMALAPTWPRGRA